RVVPRVVGAFAKLDDELSSRRNAALGRKRFPLEAADQIQQRLVFIANASELDAALTQVAQQQCARRIKTAQVAKIECSRLPLLVPLLERVRRVAERADVERTFEREPTAIAVDGNLRRRKIRGGLVHCVTRRGADGSVVNALRRAYQFRWQSACQPKTLEKQ